MEYPPEYVHLPGDKEQAASIETAVRDSLLANVMERVQNADYWVSLNMDQRSALMRYRQDLIDVTDQEGFPYNIVWPQLPF